MNQKVIVNCRFLTQPITGVQRFAVELCKELQNQTDQIIFVAPKNIIHHSIAKDLNVIKIGFLKGHLWEQIELKLFADNENALLISLCNTAPLFVKNQVITIHDLCFLKYPQWFSFTFRHVYRFLIPRIAKKATHIFTVSKTSKLEIIEELDISASKISVIYNAVSSMFNKKRQVVNEDQKILDKYILTVSSHHPRKNFERLIEAFLELNNFDFKLVIVGNTNKHFGDVSMKISDQILFKENVSDNELIQFYKNASAFIYPSLYEGFGIPIIEAMSVDTNVCVSDIPVFREICEDNAVFFDPTSKKDIKEKILYVVNKPNKSYSSFLKKYSWQKSAQKVYEQLLEIDVV